MSAFLTELDAALARDVTFQFRSKGLGTKSGFNVRFQFPPRIVSDSRKGDWVEAPLRGDEPVAVYATSGAREITMSWTYIAGARGFGGDEGQILFTPYRIASTVRALRSYFASPYKGVKTLDEALIVYFRMWYHTGKKIFTCRMKSLDVTHSNCLVNDAGEFTTNVERAAVPPGDRDRAHEIHPRRTYALRTDITAEMRLWSKVAAGEKTDVEELEGGVAGKAEEKQTEGLNPKIDLPDLQAIVPADWQ